MRPEYWQGFVKACEDRGIDAEALVKRAQVTDTDPNVITSGLRTLAGIGGYGPGLVYHGIGGALKGLHRGGVGAMGSGFEEGIGRGQAIASSRLNRGLAGLGATIGAIPAYFGGGMPAVEQRRQQYRQSLAPQAPAPGGDLWYAVSSAPAPGGGAATQAQQVYDQAMKEVVEEASRRPTQVLPPRYPDIPFVPGFGAAGPMRRPYYRGFDDMRRPQNIRPQPRAYTVSDAI